MRRKKKRRTFDIQHILEPLPLILSKQAAEGGGANIVRFVRTYTLHRKRVIRRQLKPIRSIFLQSRRRILQVYWDIHECIEIAEVPKDLIVVVEASVVRSESVVLATALGDDHDIEGGGHVLKSRVWGGLEAGSKETEGPVDFAVLDACLGGGS